MLDIGLLMEKAHTLEGLSFFQLAKLLNLTINDNPKQRKGWLGMAIESYLGADASTKPIPDFSHLGIELKTLPLNSQGKSSESTFVTRISLLHAYEETWETSVCLSKLKKVLWVPVEGDTRIDFSARRIGKPFLWSPSREDFLILKQDWMELMQLIHLGQFDSLTAHLGTYLQVRPKAADGRALEKAYDESGGCQLTLPRGFYLRASFTTKIIQEMMSQPVR